MTRLGKLYQKLSVHRQLSLSVAFGLLILACLAGAISSWQSNQHSRKNLIEQGLLITNNLAANTQLALLYASPENAAEAVNITLAFPDVIGLSIIDNNGKPLLVRGQPALKQSFTLADRQASLINETDQAWHFSSQVYSEPQPETPFSEGHPGEYLGRVSVIISKQSLSQTASRILLYNMLTSLTIALLLIGVMRVLTNQISQPLQRLSQDMRRAQMGENDVRTGTDGPEEISRMGDAFNQMMSVLEQRASELRIAAIAFETEEGMIVTDKHAHIIRINKAFTRLTGYMPAQLLGQTPAFWRSGRHDLQFFENMWSALLENKHWQGEIWNRYSNGSAHPQWVNITAVLNEDNQVTHYVGTYMDMTERKRAEEAIHELAFYDPLTKQPNRRLLRDRLRQAIIDTSRNKTSSSLLFIDLDNFKTLNDTQGHDIGDQLLIAVAQRLTGCVREGDTIARLGGDEFVLLLEGLSHDTPNAAMQTQRVAQKVLQTFEQPFELGNRNFHSSASVGITLFNNHHTTPDELLKQADTAMYEAKKSGRNAIRMFDPSMQQELEHHAEIENGLRDALGQDQLQLFYQMQVCNDGRLLGAEALLRWDHPTLGRMSPQLFIPMAESSGLILPIGRWVLESACKQLTLWETSLNNHPFQLAVNVSVCQFREADFVDQVRDIIQSTGINPKRLKLELTESVVLQDISETIEKMLALRQLGISLSLDDFGTGYSSLSYLTQLPLNQLKIDQSFVRNIGSQHTDAAIVQTIIGMAKNLGMEVIAEGVETSCQRDFLQQSGCQVYQGYLFGKPIDSREFDLIIRAH